MDVVSTFDEISSIIAKLIGLGLSVHQNFPYRSKNEILCKEGADLAFVLKNVDYSEKYFALDLDKNYSVKLLDGAIVQMQYAFDAPGKDLLAHRLAYFPAPHLKNYEDDPDAHEKSYFGESEYHDIIEHNVIKVPLRFDYSSSEKMFKDIHHPYSHLHIGEYETCRIPISRPITPSMFVNFILRNFYNTALVDFCGDYSFPIERQYNPSITLSESKIIHLNIA